MSRPSELLCIVFKWVNPTTAEIRFQHCLHHGYMIDECAVVVFPPHPAPPVPSILSLTVTRDSGSCEFCYARRVVCVCPTALKSRHLPRISCPSDWDAHFTQVVMLRRDIFVECEYSTYTGAPFLNNPTTTSTSTTPISSTSGFFYLRGDVLRASSDPILQRKFIETVFTPTISTLPNFAREALLGPPLHLDKPRVAAGDSYSPALLTVAENSAPNSSDQRPIFSSGRLSEDGDGAARAGDAKSGRAVKACVEDARRQQGYDVKFQENDSSSQDANVNILVSLTGSGERTLLPSSGKPESLDVRQAAVQAKSGESTLPMAVNVPVGAPSKLPAACPVCEKVFSRRIDMNRHLNTSHFNQRTHACTHCSMAFKLSHHLKQHMTSLHSDVKKLRCSHAQCNFETKRKGDLTRHLRTVHRKRGALD